MLTGLKTYKKNLKNYIVGQLMFRPSACRLASLLAFQLVS